MGRQAGACSGLSWDELLARLDSAPPDSGLVEWLHPLSAGSGTPADKDLGTQCRHALTVSAHRARPVGAANVFDMHMLARQRSSL